MQEITIYQDPADRVEITLASGNVLALVLPGMAILDETFIKTWLHGKAEKTQKAYSADITLLYQHTHKSLTQLRLEDLQAFLDTLTHLKPASQARITASIKSALSFGVKTGYLEYNVGAVVKLPKLENELAERIMSEQQMARMLALETNARNHAILVLLYRAGLRAAELCNLTWAKLQDRAAGGQVAVFGKGKKTRFVLIDQATWDEVMSLRQPDQSTEDYVFQSRQKLSRKGVMDGGRLDESTIHRIVRTAADRAGIAVGKVSPHWMRHAHASHSIDHGAPLPLVQATLGHSSPVTTGKYTHVRPDASSGQYLTV